MMHHVYNLPIVVIKPFNTFGPFQSPRAIIGEMIIKCLKGQEILSTKGLQTREFNYVENVVDGLMATLNNKKCIGEVINLASAKEIKIRDLILKIHEFSGSKSNLKIGELPYRPTEIWRMFGDANKAKNILKWNPKISFEDGIKKSIEWYRNYLNVFENKESKLFKFLN